MLPGGWPRVITGNVGWNDDGTLHYAGYFEKQRQKDNNLIWAAACAFVKDPEMFCERRAEFNSDQLAVLRRLPLSWCRASCTTSRRGACARTSSRGSCWRWPSASRAGTLLAGHQRPHHRPHLEACTCRLDRLLAAKPP